jgi:hypothetical protein
MTATSKVAYSNEIVDFQGHKYKDVSDDTPFSVNHKLEKNEESWRFVMQRRQDLSEALKQALEQRDRLRKALQKPLLEIKFPVMKVKDTDFDKNKIGQSRPHFEDLLDEVHKIFALFRKTTREITELGSELLDGNVAIVTELEEMLQVDGNEIVKTVKALNEIMNELICT